MLIFIHVTNLTNRTDLTSDFREKFVRKSLFTRLMSCDYNSLKVTVGSAVINSLPIYSNNFSSWFNILKVNRVK